MALIGLYGAHAAGKTTALHQMWDDASKVIRQDCRFTFMFADNTALEHRWDDGVVSLVNPHPIGRSPWKDVMTAKSALIEDCVADDSRVWVVESARFDMHFTMANAYLEYGGGVYVILVTLSAPILKLFMEQRCAKRNKIFRVDYWTPQKLGYESTRRYTNLAARYFAPVGVPYLIYEIDDGRKRWAIVKKRIWQLIQTPVGEWYNDTCTDKRFKRFW